VANGDKGVQYKYLYPRRCGRMVLGWLWPGPTHLLNLVICGGELLINTNGSGMKISYSSVLV